MTRRAIISLVIVSSILAVVVASLIVLPRLIDTSTYRHSAALWLSGRLGRAVTIDHLSFSLITGPKIVLKGLSISDDPGFSCDPFLTAREVDLSVRLIPLLTGTVVVDGITVKEPSISIIEKDGGLYNTASLGVQRRTDRTIDVVKTTFFDLDMIPFSDRMSLPEEINVRDADISYTVRSGENPPEEVARIRDMNMEIDHVRAARVPGMGRALEPSIPLCGDISVSISNGFAKGLPFEDLTLGGKIKDDTLRIEELKTAIFGGKLEGSGYLNVSPLKKELVVNARLSDVMANKLLSIIRKGEDTCFGVMNFEGTFTAAGRSTAEMIDNLSGEGLVRVEDGHIPSSNIRTQLSSLGLISASGVGTIIDTSFSIIGGSFVLSGNKFVTSKLAVKSEEWDAVLQGEVDLTGAVDFNGDIFLSHTMAVDIKPEYITSLLGNPSGRLSLPFSLSGTVDNLEFLLRPEFLTEKDADEIFEEFRREISEKYEEGYSIKFFNRISF